MERCRQIVLRIRRQAERRYLQIRHRQGSHFCGDHNQQPLSRGSVVPRGRLSHARFQTGSIRRRRPGIQFRTPVHRQH